MSSNKLTANASLASLAGILLTSVLCLSPAAAQTQESPAPAPATQPSSQAAAASTATAAPAASAVHTQRSRSVYRRHPIDDRVKELAKALNLTDVQQSGVKAVLEHQQLQARQIQFDPNLSGADRNDRFRALQQETVVRIRVLLNDEQKMKYDPLNHGTQSPDPSQNYLDQWMKHHQQPAEQHTPPPPK
jgi:hypothetical protein